MKNLDEQIEFVKDQMNYHQQDAEDTIRFWNESEIRYREAGLFDKSNSGMLAQIEHTKKCNMMRAESAQQDADMFKSILHSLEKLKNS